MKISEMTNDQATDALIRIAAPFENICNDEELIESLDKIGKMGSEPIIKVVGSIIPEFCRIGLKKHRNDLYEIIGALTMTSTSKVGKMNFGETAKALRDSYDDILKDFFSRTAIARKIAALK